MRRQPEHIKRSVLHITTFVCAIILGLLWIYSLGTTLSDKDTQKKVSNDLEPLSALKENILGGYNSISE